MGLEETLGTSKVKALKNRSVNCQAFSSPVATFVEARADPEVPKEQNGLVDRTNRADSCPGAALGAMEKFVWSRNKLLWYYDLGAICHHSFT